GNGNDRQVARSWNNERSHSKVYLHQPTITCENISGFNGHINMNKNGIFASGLTISKRDLDDDDFQPVPVRQQKRKKNLSLSKAKTTKNTSSSLPKAVLGVSPGSGNLILNVRIILGSTTTNFRSVRSVFEEDNQRPRRIELEDQ
ncbi:243_t:CDS:2, partial [Funneliformis caledonium]